MEAVREESEQARLRAMRQFGPMYEIHEDGSRTLNASLQLSHVEQQEWFVKELAARDRELPGARKALQSLAEEVAVLRMIAVSLAEPASAVSAAAEQLLPAIGDAEALDTAIVRFETAKSRLWQIANGLEDGQS